MLTFAVCSLLLLKPRAESREEYAAVLRAREKEAKRAFAEKTQADKLKFAQDKQARSYDNLFKEVRTRAALRTCHRVHDCAHRAQLLLCVYACMD